MIFECLNYLLEKAVRSKSRVIRVLCSLPLIPLLVAAVIASSWDDDR